jgi:DNA-binding transcriptional MerR regulator
VNLSSAVQEATAARPLAKSAAAFRTIAEVATDLELPAHVLRFWESRFPQIKPMKRAGGRRYYRPEDVDLLRGIKHLLYAEGYTIRGAQGILRDKGQKFVQSVWQPGAAEAADEQLEGTETELVAPQEARRSLFGLLKAPSARADQESAEEPAEVEASGSAPQQAAAPQLSRENVRRLQSVLHELRECRAAIDQALKEEAA